MYRLCDAKVALFPKGVSECSNYGVCKCAITRQNECKMKVLSAYASLYTKTLKTHIKTTFKSGDLSGDFENDAIENACVDSKTNKTTK